MAKWLLMPVMIIAYGVFELPRAFIAARSARRRLRASRPRLVGNVLRPRGA